MGKSATGSVNRFRIWTSSSIPPRLAMRSLFSTQAAARCFKVLRAGSKIVRLSAWAAMAFIVIFTPPALPMACLTSNRDAASSPNVASPCSKIEVSDSAWTLRRPKINSTPPALIISRRAVLRIAMVASPPRSSSAWYTLSATSTESNRSTSHPQRCIRSTDGNAAIPSTTRRMPPARGSSSKHSFAVRCILGGLSSPAFSFIVNMECTTPTKEHCVSAESTCLRITSMRASRWSTSSVSWPSAPLWAYCNKTWEEYSATLSSPIDASSTTWLTDAFSVPIATAFRNAWTRCRARSSCTFPAPPTHFLLCTSNWGLSPRRFRMPRGAFREAASSSEACSCTNTFLAVGRSICLARCSW
mmetsp:Transcript_81068/g.185635  ORF Transcript_81068/g.185635 Transcript_81068/m.185635 type:complete len:358 (-) Transcript_81068:806-1879(-)